jgi:hypothetical protein
VKRHKAAEQADAADEAGASDGASQLIRSVGWRVQDQKLTKQDTMNTINIHRERENGKG